MINATTTAQTTEKQIIEDFNSKLGGRISAFQANGTGVRLLYILQPCLWSLIRLLTGPRILLRFLYASIADPGFTDDIWIHGRHFGKTIISIRPQFWLTRLDSMGTILGKCGAMISTW